MAAKYRERIKAQKIVIQLEEQIRGAAEEEAKAMVRTRTKTEQLEMAEATRIGEEVAGMEVERPPASEVAHVSAERRDAVEEAHIAEYAA